MPFAAVFLLLIIAFNGCKKDDKVSQNTEVKKPETLSVYNGFPVSITNRPYQAAIFVNGSFGGGVILNENWILTAGHVVTIGGGYVGGVYAPSQIEVGTGSTQRSTLNRSSVVQIIRHPNYSIDNDIALIQLATPLQIGNDVDSIVYANSAYLSYITNNKPAVVSGWGQTENGQASNDLLYTNVVITNDAQSPSTIFTASADPQRQQAPCFGDSGGPLTVEAANNLPVLAGIVNGWGDCSTGIKGYARITHFAPWIQQITGIQPPAPIGELSISGPDYICVWGGGADETYNYNITNLPPGASVAWNVNNPWGNVVIDGPANLPQVTLLLVDNIPHVTLSASVTVGNQTIPLVKEIGAGYPENLNFYTSGVGTASDPLYFTLISGSTCLGPDYVTDIEWDYYTDNGTPVNVLSANNPYTCGVVPNDGIILSVDYPPGVTTKLTVTARAKNGCGWSPHVYYTKTYGPN